MEDSRAIILIVHSAILHYGDRSFRVARKVDPLGLRTVCVVSKIDLMEQGYDCKRMLLNDEVQIRLGFIGVMNRCQSDVDAKMSIQASREKEANFFATHPNISKMPQTQFGYKALTEKLICIQLTLIRSNMQIIVGEIRDKLAECQN